MDELLRKGKIIERLDIRRFGNVRASLDLHDIGTRQSPFPFVLSYPQDEHERLLIAHLKKAGVEVQRGIELVAAKETDAGVEVVLKQKNATEQREVVSWVAGCDGAHSTVRSILGLE